MNKIIESINEYLLNDWQIVEDLISDYIICH